MATRRPERGSRGERRGAQRALHGAIAVTLMLTGAGARAEGEGAASRDVQSRYEGCLQQLDAGAAAAATACLEEVYSGLIEIDRTPRTDLYYVLADVVAASQAAAETEPRMLCVAQRLLDDWVVRERQVPQLRLRGKVKKMAAAVAKGLEEAGLSAEGCATSEAKPVERVSEPVAVATPTEPATEREAPADGGATPAIEGEKPADAATKPAARPIIKPKVGAGGTPRSTRKLRLTARTDLMDAGFAVTIASVGVAGLGGALWAAKIECDARSASERPCPSPVPQEVRDAGLALMSIGAAGVFVGLALRWTDQRQQRKLRNAPTATASPTSVGVVWRGQF